MAKRHNMQWYDYLFFILLIAGGLNWGLVAFLNFDLVQFIVRAEVLDMIVKGLVFISAIYVAVWLSAGDR